MRTFFLLILTFLAWQLTSCQKDEPLKNRDGSGRVIREPEPDYTEDPDCYSNPNNRVWVSSGGSSVTIRWSPDFATFEDKYTATFSLYSKSGEKVAGSSCKVSQLLGGFSFSVPYDLRKGNYTLSYSFMSYSGCENIRI